MVFGGKVVGGQYVNATITTNRKGELALSLPLKRTPNLTREEVESWEEVFPESRAGAVGAMKNIGEAVARVSLPGAIGKAASAAVVSTVDAVSGMAHTVRVDWTDGKQSLIHLPDKLFQHLSILLKDKQIASKKPNEEQPMSELAPTDKANGVIGQLAQIAAAVPQKQVDVTEQIAKLAALRDQGALTESEFAAKKAELLSRI